MKQYLERQLEFPFMEEMMREENRRFHLNNKILFYEKLNRAYEQIDACKMKGGFS